MNLIMTIFLRWRLWQLKKVLYLYLNGKARAIWLVFLSRVRFRMKGQNVLIKIFPCTCVYGCSPSIHTKTHIHTHFRLTTRKQMCLVSMLFMLPTPYYLAPGGGCEVLFSPSLSVCLSVCLCVCVRPIFWYFMSQLLEEISIWNLYRILIGSYSIHWNKNWLA